MRENLKQMCGVRTRFIATVKRFGTKKSYKGSSIETILLSDVTLSSGDVVTDHVWFTCGKWSEGLYPGNVISFNARVKEYIKGYQGYREDALMENPPTLDFRLDRPTKVIVIAENKCNESHDEQLVLY